MLTSSRLRLFVVSAMGKVNLSDLSFIHGLNFMILSFIICLSRCDGSIKYLHQDCLMEWLRVSNKGDNKCELCGEKFSFRRVYSPDAPSRLSFWEFLSGVFPIAYLYLQNFFQIVIVSFFWLFIVPVVSMWWLNLCLGYLNLGVWSWGSPKISQLDILLLWWDGVIVSALISLASFCLAILLRPVFRV